MAKVSLPAAFQKWTKGISQLQISAENIDEAILEIEKKYPDLKNKILTESRITLRFVKIFVNGTDIQQYDGIKTKISEKDTVKILLALAGG